MGILACAANAGAFSLYPDRSGRDLLAELDGLTSRPRRLVLSRWQPYGLPGVSLESLSLRASVKRLELTAAAVQENWGVIRAWRLRSSLLYRGNQLRLGFDGARVNLRDGRSEGRLELLVASGSETVLSLRLPLVGAPDEGASHLGLSRRFGAWTLRVWTHRRREGIALAWQGGPLGLEWLGEGESWQGLALDYGRGRWFLRLEERLHPWLGASHGLRLGLR
jgi:hypothetical protein